MPIYYCTDSQIADLLPSLTDSQIDTEAKRNTKLRGPAREWVDSVYPGQAPFPGVSAAGGYQVNQAGHEAGDTAVTVDGGSGNPAVGDIFFVEGHNAIYKVTAWAGLVLSYRQVENFNPGVEDETATGALAAFKDDTPLHFGTPVLIQEAARWYAVSIGWQILRNTPLDEQAKAALERARELLQVGKDGLARARPRVWYEDARDSQGKRPSPLVVELRR